MTRSRKILIDTLDQLDHTKAPRKRKLSPEFERKLSELDAAIADLVRATARDYLAARERLLPNPFLVIE